MLHRGTHSTARDVPPDRATQVTVTCVPTGEKKKERHFPIWRFGGNGEWSAWDVQNMIWKLFDLVLHCSLFAPLLFLLPCPQLLCPGLSLQGQEMQVTPVEEGLIQGSAAEADRAASVTPGLRL